LSGALSGSSRILLYSDQPLVVAGVGEVFREGPLAPAALEIAADPGAVTGPGGLRAALIDLGAAGAEQALRLARVRAETLIALVPNLRHPLDATLSSEADAILLRDELEPELVLLALTAERHGVRLVARGLDVISPGRTVPGVSGANALTSAGQGSSGSGAVADTTASTDVANRALALLADGLRDAEIARILHLSESATRKLIQRTVRRLGARTRAQAVAEAVRDGQIA